MSLSYTSDEAQQRANNRRRAAALSSLGLSFLACVVAGVILVFWVIPALVMQEPTINPMPVSRANPQVETTPTLTRVQPEPSRPSAATPPIVTTTASSVVSAPVIPNITDTPIVAIGSGTGLGNFGGGTGFGAGFGTGAGEVTFFGQTSSASRVVFVIDFSGSNSKAQRKVVISEVSRSLEELPPQVKYQIFGFAGAVWVLGDEVEQAGGPQAPVGQQNQIIVGGNGREYRHDWVYRRAYLWEQNDDWIPAVDWIDSSPTNVAESIEDLKEQAWVGGTNWEVGLQAALEMSPAPEVIYFLTDGAHNVGNEHTAEEIAHKWGQIIRRDGIVLHCIALVTQKAADKLVDLAEEARGKLVMAKTDGSSDVLEDFGADPEPAERGGPRPVN